MQLFRFLAVAVLSLALAAPSFAKSVSRARLITWPNPSKLGMPAVMLAEIDGLGGGAPKGIVTFTEGDTVLGSRPINPYGAGQATIAGGGDHSCALTAAGGLACWGSNTYGQLGDGTTTNRLTPVSVSGLTSDVVAVVAGAFHTCALTRVGSVKCWGLNENRQIGDGTSSSRLTPVDVVGLQGGVIAITAGDEHNCALTRSGAVKCWGLNTAGQLGDGRVYRSAPTPVAVTHLSSGIVAIAAHSGHSCALTKGGAVACWGSNFSGELGAGYASTIVQPAPVGVLGLDRGVVAIAMGISHTCALITGGAVKCWGGNSFGQLGDGTTTHRLAPAAVSGLSAGVVAISTPGYHSCAMTSDGTVKCWGYNFLGQLGDGTTTTRYTPVAVSGLPSGVVAISAGRYHGCALIRSGAVKCWGAGSALATVTGFTALVRSRTWISTRTLGVGVHGLRASYHGDSFHGGSTATQGHVVVE